MSSEGNRKSVAEARAVRSPTATGVRVLVADAAGRKVPAVLTEDVFDALVAELGGKHTVATFLTGVATENEWPIVVRLGTNSACVPPSDWDDERAKGVLAGVDESLSAEFVRLSDVVSDGAER